MRLEIVTRTLFWALAVTVAANSPASAQSDGVHASRLALHVNGAMQAGADRLRESLQFSAYGEVARLDTSRRIGGGATFDLGGHVRLWRQLAVGVTYSQLRAIDAAVVSGAIPHPLLFNQSRVIASRLVNLRHRERATHASAVWSLPIGSKLYVAVSGGPSFLNVTQEFVTDVAVREVGPPFTQVDVEDIEVSEHAANGVGANVGLDITRMATTYVGFGLFVRFTVGSVDLPASRGSTSVRVGGFQTGGGVRVRF
jgi:hypothetical protein